MANETILIVDADTKSQKVLEVSFKKAGYRVVMTDGPVRARELVQDVSPDIIISDTQFVSGGDGFEFLADVKTGPCKLVPFIFLTEERALPQKMRGFELGADDYLTKPIYIKEVTTRVELLLQKRAKEQLTEDDIEEVEGKLVDITMIDLLQAIEEELRSGTIHLTRDGQSAVIYFREGNILDAICGKLQGEEAIYRLMLWPDGEFVLRYHDQVRRVDRVEKDSGALLLEGIRRLEHYNELLDTLPSLHHVFEADYQALSAVIEQLPPEVSRILRLFDGLRSIREVTDGSPVDDVTTLKIVQKLIADKFLLDVTPSARRSATPSRSNLAAWLDGVRSVEPPAQHAGIGREDTSPKFGASISDMATPRTTEQTEAARDTIENAHADAPREANDTDPFGSRSQKVDKPRRQTLPMRDAFDTIDNWQEEEPQEEHRKTVLQWDRPRSGWNVHFDAADSKAAAIREIEQEEHRRRDEEARQISQVHRDSTLRFAPAQSRTNGDLPEHTETVRQIEEDERHRRNEEARRLQAQMSPVGGLDTATPRRLTDELPLQAREPVIEPEESETTDELFPTDEDPIPGLRGRPNTPLSSPALQLEEVSSQEGAKEGWDALAASDASDDARSRLDDVSEADVFEDDSDEVGRLEASSGDDSGERVTLDIRPAAAKSATPKTDDVDPGGLFEGLADDETSPSEDLDEIEVEVIEILPTIERQATDNVLVTATYDLTLRKTISPVEIEGRPEAVAERATLRLRAPDFGGAAAESRFFDDDLAASYDGEAPSNANAFYIVLGILGVAAVVVIGMNSGEPDEPVDVAQPIAQNTTAQPPEETIAAPVEFAGYDASDAALYAAGYGARVGADASRLTIVLSGADLVSDSPDAGSSESDAGQAVTQVEVVAIRDPQPPVERPPVEKPRVNEELPPVPKLTGATGAAITKATRLVKQEKYDQALGLLRQLSEAVPDDKQVAYLHGYAAFSSNKTGEAIVHLTRAERLGYRTAPLYLDLAAALQIDRQKGRAKWAYEKFLELQPNGQQADEVRTILSIYF